MLDDSILISRCRAGQLELSDILVDRYKDRLYSFCRKLAGNRGEADDLFQDTWVKAFRNIHLCEPDKRFISWLFTVCLNLYRDRYRTYIRKLKIVKSYFSGDLMERELANAESKEAGPAENNLKKEQEETVRNALATLKDTLRIPMILYYYRQFSLTEISEMLGIPEGTVKSRLARGRDKIKNVLDVGGSER